MKINHLLRVVLAIAVLGLSALGYAEDIDLYSDSTATTGVPNVLFVIDTGANFSSNAAVPCTAYSAAAGGGAPSLGGTGGGVEQCALVDSIAALTSGAVRIGILVNNNNNFATDVRNKVTDAAYHETCMGSAGGCVIRNLTEMTTDNKANLIAFIKSWKLSGSNTATTFNVKSGGDATAGDMQEAWAYYNGKIGMSGKNYSDSVLASGCQRNFIIFIGNSLNNAGGPADSATPAPDNSTTGLRSAQVAATARQLVKISETVNFDAPTCGVTSIATGTSASDWSQNWADEWARLMREQDGSTTLDGRQNITTYTIGIIDNSGSNTCKPDYPALLKTAAKYGGGKYFQTGNAGDVKAALDAILNEIQATNSAFASASLPASVNAQGTYLNQIFMGLFRPDASATPRWLGNLKQYQFIYGSTGTLALGDANGKEALNAAGTGFIIPGAVSFWTKKDTSKAPDSTGGFYVNDPRLSNGDPYDSPDGELVERGGAGQQLRLENLTANFAATAGGSTNPRRLYTYCPDGASCTAALANSANAFAIENTAIAATAFGSNTTVPISSIVRTGTTALVTTSGNHGFTAGTTSVQISGANQNEYNVSQVIASPASSNTFSITGLPDYTTTPSAGTYSVTSLGGTPVAITSIVRSTDGNPSLNSEIATVTTSTSHGYTTSSNIVITGASPSAYNYAGVPSAVPTATTFTFPVAIQPTTPAANTYTVALSSSAYPGTSASLTNPATGTLKGTTINPHGFLAGQTITISGATVAAYNGTFAITSLTATTFTYTGMGSGFKNKAAATGTATPASTAQTITALSRSTTVVSGATASATVATSNWFGAASTGMTRVVNISKTAGASATEGAYAGSGVTITCTNATCTQFTYPIVISPTQTATLTSATVNLAGAASVNLLAGAITRSGATARVTGVTANAFTNGQTVTVAATGTPQDTESAYLGSWPITCTAPCSTFTFGPVTLTPTSPASGSMSASAAIPPDRDTLIKWVRGEDNFHDEKSPGSPYTVRPSIHGDVLHSRPLVINYGDSRGMVVYYGSNDGVFRAVNGSQTAAIGSVPAGGELWGLVLPEHYNEFNRQRINSPELKLSTTALSSAQPKDYFVDGSASAYQKLNADNTIEKAYIYLTMRRGGRFIYALDVSTPTAPTVLWRINAGDSGFEELGQTWSRPRVTLVKGYANPVLVFGAGYDTAEDSEPPNADSMGRGLFVVDAVTGVRVWSAIYGTSSACGGSSTQASCTVSGMNWAIPSDISFVDRDNDGSTDRFYAADVGGNVWRVDLEPTAGDTPDKWKVTKLAALGCFSTGVCPSGTTPKKFFFPPSVVFVGVTGASASYDAVLLGSGDREHPLLDTKTGSAYTVRNRFYMIKDTNTGKDAGTPTAVTHPTLFDATSTAYDDTLNGFYITLSVGEKVVNASVTVKGTTFFGTNQPKLASSTSCLSDLGLAKGYAISPFTGSKSSVDYDGGGLPPTPVVGVVTINTSDGKSTQQEFCIGCGGLTGATGGDSKSGFGAASLSTLVPKQPRRTYWYRR